MQVIAFCFKDQWVPIGKSNCYLDLDKSQSNPIYKIAVDILKHTNFFRAFTTSSTIPSIYIWQFWDTIRFDKSAGCYRCQLDEQWFDLTKDTLRDALQITPINNNQAFTSPPTYDVLINFVNKLGYPKLVRNLSNVVTSDMFQPWRALTMIINLCLTGKTSGFERPRAPRKHKFHPRPDSSLHLPNEEPVLGYLKFSANGTKREVFGIPIPGSLITADRQEASYYREYLAKVAKHQRYLAGETGSDPDSPTLKPTKPTRKPKSTAPKAPPRPSVSKPLTSAQPEPKSAPAKTQGKKRKPTTEMSDKPSKATKSRHGFVSKKRKPISTLKALEESLKSMYDVPRGPLPPVVIREPESEKYQPLPEVPGKGKAKVAEEQVAHDLLNLQKPKRKSPVDQYIFQRHTSTPTVSSGHDESSSLYTELRLSDFEEESQEVVPGADAKGQGEGQARPDPGAQAKGQARPDPSAQDEGQAGSNPDEQSEGQARPDPGNVGADEQPMPSPVVHVGSDREHMDLDVADVSPQPSTEQMDEGDKPSKADHDKATAETEAKSMVSVTIQQDMSSIPPMTSPIIDLTSRPESPKVHQLKETATKTTTTTTTTLPPPPYQQQSTAEAMMMKRIGKLEHIMANLIQENKGLEQRLDSHGARLYTLEQLHIPHQVSKAVNEVVTDAVDWAMQAPLQNRFRDLPEIDMKEILHQQKSINRDHSEELAKDLAEARKKNKKSRESPKTPLGSPPHQPPPPPPAGPSGASGSSRASGSSKVLPPLPLPPSTNQEGPSKGSVAPSSSKTAASAEYQAWTTTDIRLRPSISLTPTDLQMDKDMATDEQVQSSDDEDIGSTHIPKVNLRQDWWKPLKEERPATPEPAWSIPSSDVPVSTNNWASALASNYLPPPEDSLLAQTGDIAMFMDWFCKRRGITELKPQDLEGPAFEIIKVFYPDVIHLQYQMEECHKLLTDSMDDSILRHNVSKPLPLGGPPGQVTIQSDLFFNKDLEYLRYDSKGSRHALSISKMKAAYYPDVSLEQMVPNQIWIDEECKYDITAIAVMTHMWILSVLIIEVFSMYGYDYMKKIVLRHLNHLPPKDKKILTTTVNQWTRHLVIRQRVEDFQLGIESYQAHLNLTKPRWDVTGFEYKHDYTVIDSPRVVTFRDRYGVQMMMRFNEIHKFSDGTLQLTRHWITGSRSSRSTG
nr:E-beta-farnesene synthase [Tanacetum cinerariifolium]